MSEALLSHLNGAFELAACGKVPTHLINQQRSVKRELFIGLKMSRFSVGTVWGVVGE